MRKQFLVILISMFFIFSGCGPQTARINMVGSTSVQPIAELLAEKYLQDHHDVSINVQGGGSSAGIKAALDKTAEIGTSSRLLTISEVNSGLTATEIALDGIAIIINPQNRVQQLTLEQARKIFAGEITNWSKVGGSNKTIVVVNREEGSGTRGAFTEIVMDKTLITSNALVQGSTGAVRQTVSGNPEAIGYISLAANDPTVKIIAINGVACTIANIKAKTYPIVRSFLFVTIAKKSDEVKSFIDYVLTDGQAVIIENGLVSIEASN
jgi:phosphate transport system substrate-binding protein